MSRFGGKRYRLTFAVSLPTVEGRAVQMLVEVLPGMEQAFVGTVTQEPPTWVDLQNYCVDRDAETWVNTRYVVSLSEMEDR